MSQSWRGGLISAAVYIKHSQDERKFREFTAHTFLHNVDYHLVSEPIPLQEEIPSPLDNNININNNNINNNNNNALPLRLFPVNILRNVALDNALTDWVLLLDVDFVPSLSLYNNSRYIPIQIHFLHLSSNNIFIFSYHI